MKEQIRRAVDLAVQHELNITTAMNVVGFTRDEASKIFEKQFREDFEAIMNQEGEKK